MDIGKATGISTDKGNSVKVFLKTSLHILLAIAVPELVHEITLFVRG